jgi:hypothetical protein
VPSSVRFPSSRPWLDGLRTPSHEVVVPFSAPSAESLLPETRSVETVTPGEADAGSLTEVSNSSRSSPLPSRPLPAQQPTNRTSLKRFHVWWVDRRGDISRVLLDDDIGWRTSNPDGDPPLCTRLVVRPKPPDQSNVGSRRPAPEGRRSLSTRRSGSVTSRGGSEIRATCWCPSIEAPQGVWRVETPR